ncbi:MAG: FtsX-like permease family protein [Bifidobacterium sp.]|uniref:FtsX-like permease family protein n=1 Tax=Bifidobacterium fermentum TaxID=3059035 RepID=A0AB39UES2_9BIFI
MIKLGLRDARSHFSRFVMSIIAIALGVAFVVGSFCFREMLNNQVSEMLSTNADADVYVRGTVKNTDDSSTSLSSSSDYNLISDSLIDTASHVEGVSGTSPLYTVSGLVLVGKDGNAVATTGAPTLATGFSSKDSWRSVTFTSGTYAKNSSELALDSYAASRAGLKVGDSTTLVYPTGPAKVKVVGVFSTKSSQAGAIILGIDESGAKALYQQTSGSTTKIDEIGLYGNANHGNALTQQQQQQLADKVNAAIPSGSKATAITGDEMRAEKTKSTQDSLGFIQPMILIFALIALFVGSFIIANTFSMIVRESMRGYALLRSVGASPSQVFLTVVIQAIVLGVVGSGIGIGLGWGMIKLIVYGISQSGSTLTGSSNPTVPDMIVGVIVGVAVSLIGAALPARHASLAPPLQAMNETVNPEKPTRVRGILGFAMIVFGVGFWCLSWILSNDGKQTPWDWLNSTNPAISLGIGAALILLGTIVMAPAIVQPVSRILGWIPSLAFPVTGRLASRNLARSKRRTANTAAALFVGVAIVSCLGVMASSVNASVSGIIESGIKADFAVLANGGMGRIPQQGIDAMKKVKGVKSISSIAYMMDISYPGTTDKPTTYMAQPSLFTDVYDPVDTAGNAKQAMDKGQLVVSKSVADDNDWQVGQSISVKSAQGTEKLTIGAISDNSIFSGSIYVNQETAAKLTTESTRFIAQAYVKADAGQNLKNLKADLIKAVKPYYVISVMTKDEYKSSISSMVNQVLLILNALLALSILIAIFGIVNTLALSVSERTKEIGLLRAIGAGRGQIRGMIAIEASMISVFGTILGLIVGTAAGVVIRRLYASQGLTELNIPVGELVGFVILAILVGMITSLPPARKALKVPVLNAVASE